MDADPALVHAGLEILDERECVRLLHTARVGRLAVSLGGLVTVLPVNFIMVGSDILFFTGEGVKLNAALAEEMVTFEADHIDVDARTGWSVVAVGTASPGSHQLRARAQALGLFPWAAGARPHLVRIRPTFLSGRRILP